MDLALDIVRAEVVRLLGYPEGRAPRPSVAPLVDDALAAAARLARPRGEYVRLTTARAGDLGLRPLEAAGLAAGLVTIGPALEEEVSRLLAAGEEAAALALDAAGSAAAEQAADRLGAEIAGAGAGRAVDLPCRVSPGYGGWPLTFQRQLLALLPAEALGVRLTPSLMMVPRKSVSFAMWLGAAGPPAEGRAGCARCALRGCRFRRRP